MKHLILGKPFAITALASLMAASPSAFGVEIVVTQLQPAPVPAVPTVDAWYQSDVRTGGTATIQNLTGMGGNLESNQPLPTGAARLTTDGTDAAKAEVATYANFGLASSVLGNIDLGYSYFKSTTIEQAAAPSIKLSIFAPGGTGDNFGTLVYEPYWNGGNPPQGSWQSVSIDENTGSGADGSGGWWWNGGFGVANTAGGPPIRSLSEWLTLFQASDPTDFANASVVSLSVGVGTYNRNQDDYFDAVSISIPSSGIDKTYNFQAASVPDGGMTLAMLLAGGALVGVVRRTR